MLPRGHRGSGRRRVSAPAPGRVEARPGPAREQARLGPAGGRARVVRVPARLWERRREPLLGWRRAWGEAIGRGHRRPEEDPGQASARAGRRGWRQAQREHHRPVDRRSGGGQGRWPAPRRQPAARRPGRPARQAHPASRAPVWRQRRVEEQRPRPPVRDARGGRRPLLRSVSRSGRLNRSSATSRSTRGSGAWRISISALPMRSSARVIAAGPIVDEVARAVSACASDRWSSDAPIDDRNASRRRARRSSPITRGSRPAFSASLTPATTCPASAAASAAMISSMTSVPRGTPPAATTWSSADSVSRAEPLAGAHHVVDHGVVDLEPGVLGDPADMRFEILSRDQLELVVLRPAPDGGDDLVGLGRGQDEHDVVRRLLERLQQRVLGTRRQHVDLVQDVHLGAPG